MSVHSLLDANVQTDPTCLSVVYGSSPASDRQAVNGRWTLSMTESQGTSCLQPSDWLINLGKESLIEGGGGQLSHIIQPHLQNHSYLTLEVVLPSRTFYHSSSTVATISILSRVGIASYPCPPSASAFDRLDASSRI